MNARIIKEARSLLPVFGVMLLAAALPPLIWRRDTASGIGMVVFVACAAVLAASSFGNEFQWRTLPLLLTQPVPRRRLWLEKMLVLAVALTLGFVTLLACTYAPDSNDHAIEYLAVALVPLCALCGAALGALSIKNTIGAAAVIFILPMGGWVLLIGLEQGVAHYFPRIGELFLDSFKGHELAYLCAYGLIYCAVAGRLGYSMFLRLEAVESQARDIGLPAGVEAALARPLRRLVPGYTGPWASLIRKELQLQRVSFILAGLMLALVPFQLIGWKLFHSELLGGTLGMNFVICFFVIPLVAAGMSVAEERNLGLAAWQFIQPVSARKQWTAKILVTLFVCVTLGVLLPAAGMEIRHAWLGFEGPKWPNLTTPEEALSFFIGVPLFYLLLISLGIYASSLSRTTLQAVIRTLALIMIFAAAFAYLAHVFDRIARGSPIFWTPGRVSVTGPEAERLARLANEYAHVLRTRILTVLATVGALMAFVLGLFQFLAFANFRKGDQATERAWLKSGILVVLICVFVFAVFVSVAVQADDMVSHWVNTHL